MCIKVETTCNKCHTVKCIKYKCRVKVVNPNKFINIFNNNYCKFLHTRNTRLVPYICDQCIILLNDSIADELYEEQKGLLATFESMALFDTSGKGFIEYLGYISK